MSNTDIDYIEQKLGETTLPWPQMVRRYGADWRKWPASTSWFQALTRLETLRTIAPPPPPLPSALVVTFALPSTISSPVVWISSITGTAAHVEFYVDNVLLWTEAQPPYQFNGDPDGKLDPAALTAGVHTLKVVALAADGTKAEHSQTVTVQTASPPPTPTPSGYANFVGTVSSDLALARAKGITNVRIDIGMLDKAEIDTFRNAGGSVIPIACYNPWSDLRPSGKGDHYAPDTDARRVTWSQRMVQSIQGKFAVAPEAIEVWNEPWLTGFWNAGPNPSNFIALCKAFAVEAWKVWPAMKILVSSDPGWGGWGDNLIAADTGKFLTDRRVFPTVHPYCGRAAPGDPTSNRKEYAFTRYDFPYDAWKQHGHPDPQVWLTEFGWISNTPGGNGDAGQIVSEADQAKFTADAYRIAHDSGKVAKAYAYMLSPNQAWSYNWLRPDNSEKPIVAAVKALIAT